jgi:hypothetical protein
MPLTVKSNVEIAETKSDSMGIFSRRSSYELNTDGDKNGVHAPSKAEVAQTTLSTCGSEFPAKTETTKSDLQSQPCSHSAGVSSWEGTRGPNNCSDTAISTTDKQMAHSATQLLARISVANSETSSSATSGSRVTIESHDTTHRPICQNMLTPTYVRILFQL